MMSLVAWNDRNDNAKVQPNTNINEIRVKQNLFTKTWVNRHACNKFKQTRTTDLREVKTTLFCFNKFQQLITKTHKRS